MSDKPADPNAKVPPSDAAPDVDAIRSDGTQATSDSAPASEATTANEGASAGAAATAGEGSSAGEGSPTTESAAANAGKPLPQKKDRSIWLWVGGILFLLCLELFIYGRNGRIQVCVGVEGVTDFALKGEPRTKENQRKMPQCAERLNLGMYDHAEEQATAALKDACGRATMMNKEQLPACMNRDKKWTRRVTKEQIAPWDKRLYRRLLWLE